MGKLPNIIVPGLNRGKGIPSGYLLGRAGTGRGPVQLINGSQLHRLNIVTKAQLQTAIPVIADGDILANTSGGAAQPIATTLSNLLDYVFSTSNSDQGTILFRGAAGWTKLTPGTAGEFLQTAGAGADVLWASAGGGGGRDTEAAWTKPLVADFGTTVNIVRSSASNGTNAMLIDFPGANSNNELYLKAAPGSTPYDLTTRFKHHIDSSAQQSQAGIVLRNSTSGKIVIFGMTSQTNSNVLAQNWNSATSFNSTIFNVAMWPSGPTPWFSINNDGTTLTFSISEDGWNWHKAGATSTLASFLSSADQVGIYVFAGGGTNYCRMTVHSFGTALPAP